MIPSDTRMATVRSGEAKTCTPSSSTRLIQPQGSVKAQYEVRNTRRSLEPDEGMLVSFRRMGVNYWHVKGPRHGNDCSKWSKYRYSLGAEPGMVVNSGLNCQSMEHRPSPGLSERNTRLTTQAAASAGSGWRRGLSADTLAKEGPRISYFPATMNVAVSARCTPSPAGRRGSVWLATLSRSVPTSGPKYSTIT